MDARTALLVLCFLRQHRAANWRQPIFLPLEVKLKFDWVVVSRLLHMLSGYWYYSKVFSP